MRILQGAQDPDVPWQHAFALAHRLPAEDVVLTMIQDGDHRLSRPQDIARIIAAVAEIGVRSFTRSRSSSAKADDPVRRGLSIKIIFSGILDAPSQCAIAHKAGHDRKTREKHHEHFHHAPRFCDAVEQRNGKAFAELFTEDGVYHDVFYGAFEGRAKIAEMIDDWFYRTATDFRWDMHAPVSDGHTLYARYTFSYRSTLPEAKGARAMFEGVAIMKLRDGKIAEYHEVANTAPASSTSSSRPSASPRSSPSRARR